MATKITTKRVLKSGHMLVVLTTNKGYCYYVLWNEPHPINDDQIMTAWKNERKDFLPYWGQYGY